MMFFMQQSKAAPVNPYQSMMGQQQPQQPIIIGGSGMMGTQMPYGGGMGQQMPYGGSMGQQMPYGVPYGYNNGTTQLAQTRVTQQASVANNLINKAPDIISSAGKLFGIGTPADASVAGDAATYDGSLLNQLSDAGGSTYDFGSSAIADSSVASAFGDAAAEDALGAAAGLPPGSITLATQVLGGDVIDNVLSGAADIFDW